MIACSRMSSLIPHGWRARLYHLSRHPKHLGVAAAGMLLAGMLGAAMIVARTPVPPDERQALRHYFDRSLADGLQKFPNSKPRVLAEWLHDVTTGLPDLAERLAVPVPGIEGFNKSGRLMGIQVGQAILQCAGPMDQQALFRDYVIARIDSKEPRGRDAWKRIESAALRVPPAPLANEFLGYLLERSGMKMEALNAFRREGAQADARHARSCALELAVDLGETRTLRELIYAEPYQSEASPNIRRRAGALLGDLPMRLKGMVEHSWQHFQLAPQLLALLSAMLWFAVLISFTPRQPWRWMRYTPAVIAGVASIAPTLALVYYQEVTMGFVSDGTFPHDLIYYVVGVGVREEVCKLALFALFLPRLLKRRDPTAALLTGACVGLGFAWEENTGYYASQGVAVAIGRFLTANFMHASMTGIAGLALYQMVRTRFGSADRFVATFFAVVVAHGLYDWTQTAHVALPDIGDLSIFSIVILALLANHFFDELNQFAQVQHGRISLVAVFVLGASLLVAISFIMVAASTGSMSAVVSVAVEAVSLVPIMVLYVRRFGH